MNEPNLERCPFCDNSAIVVEIGGGAAYQVKCRNIMECGAMTEKFDTEEEATAAWNRRAPLPDNKALTERDRLFALISAERDRQDAKWGFPQENTYCEWSSILAEETGELAKELNELNFGRGEIAHMVEEAIQVAAVAMSILEQQETAHMVTAAWYAYRHPPEKGE